MVSNIFILDKNLKTKLILSINGHNTFFKDLYDLDLSTGTESYEFSTTAEDINESDYIMFHYHGDYKLFQIIDIEQEHREGKIITSVYGESACLELLNGVTEPIMDGDKAIAMTAGEFIDRVLASTDWQRKRYSSSLDNKVVDVKIDKTRQIWPVIQEYMKDFGYEITTRVKYENGYVKKKYIDVYAEGELGNKTCKRFEYSRNVKGMTKKKNLYDFCTALILETKQDTNGIMYGNREGNILKPKDGIIKDPDSNAVYAVDNNKTYNANKNWIYGVYEDNDSNSGTETVEKAVKELKVRSVPKFDYECDTAVSYEEYENINIGDTVYVIDHTFNPIITLEARVGKLEISFTDRDNCKCTLSNYKEIKTRITADDSHIKDLLDRTTIQYEDSDTGKDEITLKDDYMDTKKKLEEHLLECEQCGCQSGSGVGDIPNPIKFYNKYYPSETETILVGRIGSRLWEGSTSRYKTYYKSESNCDLSIGGTDSRTKDNILITDKDSVTLNAHGCSEVVRQGLNLVNPNLSGTINCLRQDGTYSGTITGNGNQFLQQGSSIYRNDCLLLAHHSTISLCFSDEGLNLTGDGEAAFYITKKLGPLDLHAGFVCNVNMHGYRITNLGGYSLASAAQSEYTASLIDRGTVENIMYSNLSYDPDEIRWCWKETVFTYAESDIDPETDQWVYTGRYICYVELPIFMAENIENDYHINVSKMSWGDYRIIEKTPYYFILESQEDNFAFTFEVVAKLIDSDNQTTSHDIITVGNGLAEPEDINKQDED